MDRLRVSKKPLGYPVWTFEQVGDIVYVTIDPECPEDETSIRACLTAILDSTPDINACLGDVPRGESERPSA